MQISQDLNHNLQLTEARFQPIIDNFLAPISKLRLDFGPYKNHLRVAHLNTASIPKHRDEIQRVMLEADLDIFAASETNIKPGTPSHLYKVPGYKLIKQDRTHTTKGGVGVYFKEVYKPKRITVRFEELQPEILFTEVEINKNKIAIGTIYKSPRSSYGVYAEIQEILAFITTKYNHVILLGDFNIDLLKNDRPSEFFRNVILQPLSLHQVIREPTRITETTATNIDHIFVTSPDSVKFSGVVDFPGISDHCLIYMAYSLKRPKFQPTTVVRRDFKNFEKDSFLLDMERAPWGNVLTIGEDNQPISLNDKVTVLENIYKDCMDKHASYKEITIKRPVKASWMTDEILSVMDNRDKYKNLFNRFKDSYFWDRYKELRNDVNHRIRRAKIKEFNEKVNDKIMDSKKFHSALKQYNVVSDKKGGNDKCPFPPDRMNDTFCESHNAEVDFDKIARTINNINNKNRRGGSFELRQVTDREVIDIVKSLKSNACGVDDISAFFVKLSITQAATALTDIINSSFSQGIFPDRWKKAIVIPIPKLDNPQTPSDYRPISLLSVLSKIIEKLVALQIVAYLTLHNLFDTKQSAYRKNHGCPTALLEITDEFFKALDKGEIVICTLLDYSKAFNCANHDITLAKLKWLGFSNSALRWVNSYLSGRSQSVKTQDGFSNWKNLANGVPQGSILGPLFFTILINDFKDIIQDCGYHLYADDSRIFISGPIHEILLMINKLNSDLNKIADFSVANNLSLNVGKCKFIILGSTQSLEIVDSMILPNIMIQGRRLERKREVYNLGVLVDENLTWETHVNKTIGQAYGKLKNAYHSKNLLDRKGKIVVVEYYILSQLNYCNIIMQNLKQSTKMKIQKLQNACTRFIFGLRKFDHISEHFRQLNVLNMENRRTLHSATLMHKITRRKAPTYLCSKICYRNAIHLHNTRGNSKLHIPIYRRLFGRDRYFRKVAHAYNNFMDLDGFSQDMSIDNFKKKLKRYLIENQ